MKPLFLLTLLVAFVFSFAQQNEKIESGIIKGNVSTSDGQRAGFVSVRIKNSKIGTTTDENGKFEIRKLKPGNYILIFSLAEYSPREDSVDVKASETTLLNVQVQLTFAELQKVIVESHLASKYVEANPSSSLRLNYPINEIPQNIQITTRQLLNDQGLISMSEAIRTVSGIQKNNGGLNDYTMNIRGTEGPHNVFRNGLGGYWWNQQEEVDMLEKIEFIKGPAGFIVSNHQPGGFVNNVTKQPVKEKIASVNIGFGSYNLMRLATDFGGRFSEKSNFSYRFNAGLHKQERAFQFGKASRYFICGAVKYEPDTKNTVTAEYNYMWGRTSGNNDDLPSINGKMFSLPRNFSVADANTDKLTVADNYYRLLTTHKFNDNWQLNLLLGYMVGKWGGGYLLGTDNDILITSDTLYRASSFDDWRNFSKMGQVYLQGKFNTGKKIEHKILAALDYRDFAENDKWGGSWGEKRYGLYIPNPDYYIDPDSLKNFAIDNMDSFQVEQISGYTQDHMKIAGKLVVTLAGRFTHAVINIKNLDVPEYLQKTLYNIFTPRAGLTWLFSEDVSVYALYDQCFLPQNAKNFEHKPFKPLTGYNIEAGLKSYFFNKKLSLNSSIYKIVKNNSITSDPLYNGYYIQTGQVVSKGIELDMTGNITSALVINANYAYTDAKVTKDSDSSLIGIKNYGTPDHYANLWAKYKFIHGKFRGVSFSIGYQYMGRRSAVVYGETSDKGNKYMPVYNLLDAGINYGNERFNISLNMYNISNIQYAVRASFIPAISEWRYTPGEPVNFRLRFGINLIRHKIVRKDN